MADLDEEFARFQAELASIEAANAQANTQGESTDTAHASKPTKRAREDEDLATETTAAKKRVTEAVVIAAKPKIYSAPPRPVSVRRDAVDTTPSVEQPSLNSASTAIDGGALSGFPAGTTGEFAAGAGLYKKPQAPGPRIDMLTGTLLSSEEQQQMNMQQSVYDYDPNKRVPTNTATGPNGAAKKNLRMAGGEIWEDKTLADWPDDDFRLFVGDLGNEANDEILSHAFSRYPSFQRSRVVRDKYTHKTKGFGFVSFSDPFDCAKAMREMNGKYIGNRPVKITKSKWQDRNIDVARKKAKKKSKHLF